VPRQKPCGSGQGMGKGECEGRVGEGVLEEMEGGRVKGKERYAWGFIGATEARLASIRHQALECDPPSPPFSLLRRGIKL